MRVPLALAIGLPKWRCKAVQRSKLPASTAPFTPLRSKFNYLSCPLSWSLHAFMVRGPLSPDIGPPKWHCKAAPTEFL